MLLQSMLDLFAITDQETLLFSGRRFLIAYCLFLPFLLPSVLSLPLQKCDCLLSLEAYSADQKRRVCQCLKDSIDKQLQLHRREPHVPHFEQVRKRALTRTRTHTC